MDVEFTDPTLAGFFDRREVRGIHEWKFERMMVLTDKPTLEIDDLPSFIRQPQNRASVISATRPSSAVPGAAESAAPAAVVAMDGASLDPSLATMTLANLEERAIAAALTRFNNNRPRAARALGISVRTLQRKLNATLAGHRWAPPTHQRRVTLAPLSQPSLTVPHEGQAIAKTSPASRRELASKAGKEGHLKGTAHEWTREEAVAAAKLSHEKRAARRSKAPPEKDTK